VGDLSAPAVGPKVHNSRALTDAIMRVHFGELLESGGYVFDYDDTIVSRGNKHHTDSQCALSILNELNTRLPMFLCTGNSIKSVNLITDKIMARKNITDDGTFAKITDSSMRVFADGGINLYDYKLKPQQDRDDVGFSFVKCVEPTMQFDKTGPLSARNILHFLQSEGITGGKLENRGDVMIAIKPIDPEYRPIIVKYIKATVCGNPTDESRFNITVRTAGRSTIEICNKNLSKQFAMNYILENKWTHDRWNPLLDTRQSEDHRIKQVTYVGDELYNGNDEPIREMAETDKRIKWLNVNSIGHTVIFMRALWRNSGFIRSLHFPGME
jgi:hypothetical protein